MRTFRIYVTFCLVLLLCFIALMPSVHASDASESDVLSSYGIDASSQFMGGEPNYHDDYLESYYNRYLIPIVVAADEKFQANSYWVPWNVNGLGWKEAILNIVERADNDIYEKYRVNFRVIEFVTWQSNDSLHDRAKRLHELADDLNWNPSVHGKIILPALQGRR